MNASRGSRIRVGGLSFGVFATRAPHASAASPDSRYVLVHGIGTSHHYLSRLHRELARSADVWSIDLPGFGSAPKPASAPDVGEMANALGRVLEGVGGPPFVMIGHSMGAQWVTELARLRPDLVRAVVLIGPVVDREHRSVLAQFRALAVDALRETPSVNGLVLTAYLRCGPRYFLRQARYMVRYRLEERIAEVRVPALVVRGGRDVVAGARWSRLLRDRATRSGLVTFARHRHAVQHTAPREVAAAIREFA